MSEFTCPRCNVNLTQAISILGLEGVKILHQAAHTREDLESTRKQLHETQCAGKRILVDWEKNLTEAVQELAQFIPDVCVCPWCSAPILDPKATKESECPDCGHNLVKYLNKYHCDDCNTSWEDEWSSGCDDPCPKCGVDTSPHDSEEIEQHE